MVFVDDGLRFRCDSLKLASLLLDGLQRSLIFNLLLVLWLLIWCFSFEALNLLLYFAVVSVSEFAS